MNQKEIQERIDELEEMEILLDQKISSAYELENEKKYKKQLNAVLEEIEHLEVMYEECANR